MPMEPKCNRDVSVLVKLLLLKVVKTFKDKSLRDHTLDSRNLSLRLLLPSIFSLVYDLYPQNYSSIFKVDKSLIECIFQ